MKEQTLKELHDWIITNVKKGRPKGEHKTMISARLNDNALQKLKEVEKEYGIKKSDYINRAIIAFYYDFIKMNKQNYLTL